MSNVQDDFIPTILLPEPDDPAVAKYISDYSARDSSLRIRADNVELEAAADMLNNGEVDAVVVGARHPSKEVFLTAIRKIGAVNKDASSFFVMEKEGQPTLYFADCAVNPEPDANRLVRIAEQTCRNAERLGDRPVVAFISYSTAGSGGNHPAVLKVQEAAAEFRVQHPDIIAYGDIQWDAATNEEIYKKKNKGSGYTDGRQPNVFIFPNLDAGNSMYKAMEWPGGYTAIGPLTQGLDGDADFHDLSRGVTAEALERICQTVARLVQARHQNNEQVTNDS
jgi:phosphotransacetylase